MTKRFEREEARRLRHMGLSIKSISKKLNVAKSSVSIWVRDIQLNQDQKDTLRMYSLNGHPQNQETREKIRIACISNNTAMRFSVKSGNSVHRKNENKVKTTIENNFNTLGLLPAYINGRWFDFANDEYIIEYTQSCFGGISNAISRFSDIIDDHRKKVLIAPQKNFGKLRRKRIANLGVEFVPIWF